MNQWKNKIVSQISIIIIVVFALTGVGSLASAKPVATISAEQAKALITQTNITNDIKYLADKCEGRLLCSKGDQAARAYLVKNFKSNGVLKINGSYEQPMYCKKYDENSANVWGIIHGNDPVLKNEVIVVGAHFDHLGKGENGKNFAGANDNASGCASLLAIQKAMLSLKKQVKRTIVFVAFTGEEYEDTSNAEFPDFLGSRYFIENSPYPIENTAFMLNMDMMLRNNSSISQMTADQKTKRVKSWFDMAYNEKQDGEDTKPNISYESYGDPLEDASMFREMDIPQRTMYIEDKKLYHTVNDTTANTTTLNYKGCTDFAKLTFDLLWKLAQDPVERVQ